MSKAIFPTWVYHAKHEAKVVQSDVAEELYKNGWEDSPAKCKQEKEVKK